VSHCAVQHEMRQLLRDYLTRSEWDSARDGMKEAGVDEATLAARWREREGRSVLDPLPAVQAASAPGTVN
jgi:hypothetical protein